jgi:hypothetical protein
VKRRRLPGAGGSMDGGLAGGRGEQKNQKTDLIEKIRKKISEKTEQ